MTQELQNKVEWFKDKEKADERKNNLGEDYVILNILDVGFAVTKRDFLYETMEKDGYIPTLASKGIKWIKNSKT